LHKFNETVLQLYPHRLFSVLSDLNTTVTSYISCFLLIQKFVCVLSLYLILLVTFS